MAKGAAKEEALGGLHSLLATVFQKTLEKYLAELAVLDKFEDSANEEFADEFLAAAVVAIGEPNPAMLSAISKFLKDNDIGLDSEEVDALNATQQRLDDMRNNRPDRLNLKVVPLVAEG